MGVWMRNVRTLLGCPGLPHSARVIFGDDKMFTNLCYKIHGNNFPKETLPGLQSHSPLFMVPRVKLEYRLYLVRRLFDSNHLGWREQKRGTSAGDGGK
ncbi:unnamed protein product [Prunus armeniaca]|uniref:Uncharacterized protein n=1 Tax=Prunus armeniaca TaxID=36596 RepID=A0A6J5Y1H5_PRUAR|nr:unnamed protein product [Prunus armeniaca]